MQKAFATILSEYRNGMRGGVALNSGPGVRKLPVGPPDMRSHAFVGYDSRGWFPTAINGAK